MGVEPRLHLMRLPDIDDAETMCPAAVDDCIDAGRITNVQKRGIRSLELKPTDGDHCPSFQCVAKIFGSKRIDFTRCSAQVDCRAELGKGEVGLASLLPPRFWHHGSLMRLQPLSDPSSFWL